MFNFIHCDASTVDIILTLGTLSILFVIDMFLSISNLTNLQKLYPKTYLKFEQNIFMKYLIKRLGLNRGFFIYLFVCSLLFWVLVWYVLNPSIIIGAMFVICFLIHLPNFFEIKKRLKKRGIK